MIQSIITQWKHSASGCSLRNRILIFLLGIHAGLGEHRHLARWWLYNAIGWFGRDERVVLSFIVNEATVRLAMRRGDRADYLVAGELICGGYDAPVTVPARIVDAGANIGTFCLAATTRFPGVPITVYEPNESNFAILEENLRENRVPALFVKKGVWSADVTLYFQERDSYTGFISKDATGVRVECVLPEVAANDWLKLDVEGAEHEVLPALFSKGRFPYFISLELHHRRSKGDSLIALARAHGYVVRGPIEADADCINLSLSRSAT